MHFVILTTNYSILSVKSTLQCNHTVSIFCGSPDRGWSGLSILLTLETIKFNLTHLRNMVQGNTMSYNSMVVSRIIIG